MESTVVVREDIHPNFLKLMEICNRINFGTIKELKVQDGLPVFVRYDIRTELDAIVEVSKKLA